MIQKKNFFVDFLYYFNYVSLKKTSYVSNREIIKKNENKWVILTQLLKRIGKMGDFDTQ